LAPGNYDLFYRLKEKETGINWSANTKITVTTPYSRGFLIMGTDDQGRVEAEMLSMINDTVHVRNVLSESGLPALNGPISFFHTSGTATYSRLWVMTESGSYYLNPATLEATPNNTL